MVDRCTEAIYIGSSICLSSTAKLLRCCISSCSQPGSISVVMLLVFSRSTEIDQHNLPVGTQHYVRGLHISVNDRRDAAVQVAEHITELFRPVNDQVNWLRPAGIEKILQASALDIIHYNNKTVVCIYNINNARQVRMVEFLEHFSLCDQSLAHHFLIVSAVLAHFFDRPCFIGTLIKREIHNTHPAVSDLIQNLIFSVQHGTYLKHRSVFLSRLMCFNENRADIVVLISLNIQSDQIG